MTRIRHQFVTTKIASEDLFASSNRFVDVHAVEASTPPCLFRTLNNEGRRVGIELIGVHPDPAVLSLFEDKGECVVEFLMRSEPDVFARTNVDVGLECVGVRRTDPRINAISADNDVIVFVAVDRRRFRLELDLYTERTCTILENVEKPLAPNTAEAVAARPHDGATIVNGDIIPINERVANCFGGDGVVGVEIAERLVGQNDTPAKSVIRSVAFNNQDVVRRVAQLERNREVKPARAAPQNCRTHASAPFAVTCASCRSTQDITNIKYLDLKLMAAADPRGFLLRHQWLTIWLPPRTRSVGILIRRLFPNSALLH